jgi:quercetin dioxygenase-like cupin family protein
MRLFRFDASAGHAITAFDSANVVMSGIQRRSGHYQIGCMHIGAGGVVGHHQAVGPQLFLVVAGEGWVRGETEARQRVSAGRAAFWSDGEWHESGSEHGMTAIVLEGEGLDPGQFMREERAE